MTELTLHPIAHIESDFPALFGIPRQSGLVPELTARIILEPLYRDPSAFRGLEGFSHLWLLWGFSANKREGWAAAVKPPRLGGNRTMGVFATRSPYRPNPVGLSCVRLERVELTKKNGPVLHVSGADLMDGTPIYDIKPYLPYTDSRPEAVGGFAEAFADYALEVEFPPQLQNRLPPEKREAAARLLARDPRPAYIDDPERIYGVLFAGFDLRFRVEGQRLYVVDAVPAEGAKKA